MATIRWVPTGCRRPWGPNMAPRPSLGGTGALGRGVATRFASIGEAVVIGSRDAARAAAAAAELNALVGRAVVSGAANAEAAAAGEIVFVCVPFAAQDETLRGIRAAVA